MGPGAIFTLLQFLYNLRISPISYIVTLSGMEILIRNKHSSLLDPFISTQKMKCCEYAPWSMYYKNL
jgi:hypothetical protein